MLRNLVSKRNVISISLGVLALAAMTFALRPRVAKAGEDVAFKGAFTVQAELIQSLSFCAPNDNDCSSCVNNSSFYVDAQGIGDTSLGTMFIKVLKCFNPASAPGAPNGSYAGTFTMTAPNRKDSVSGTYSGVNDDVGAFDSFYGWGPFSGTLRITGGTGKFDGVQGSAKFRATAGQIGAEPSPDPDWLVMAFYSVQGNLVLPGSN
jgi:hypothetical protein